MDDNKNGMLLVPKDALIRILEIQKDSNKTSDSMVICLPKHIGKTWLHRKIVEFYEHLEELK